MDFNQRTVLPVHLLQGPLHGAGGGAGRQPADEEDPPPHGLCGAVLRPSEAHLLSVGPPGGRIVPGTHFLEGCLGLRRQSELHESVAPRGALLLDHEATYKLPERLEHAPQALGIGLGQQVPHEQSSLGLTLDNPHGLSARVHSRLLVAHALAQRRAVRRWAGAHAAQRAALAVRERRDPCHLRPV